MAEKAHHSNAIFVHPKQNASNMTKPSNRPPSRPSRDRVENRNQQNLADREESGYRSRMCRSILSRSGFSVAMLFGSQRPIPLRICTPEAMRGRQRRAKSNTVCALADLERTNATHQRAGAIRIDFKTDPTAGSVACACSASSRNEGEQFKILHNVGSPFRIEIVVHIKETLVNVVKSFV